MSLTYANLKDVIDSVLSTETNLTDYPYSQIINDAGNHFYNMHPWMFRQRGRTALVFAPNQEYVNLPPDLEQITAYSMSTSSSTFGWTDPQTIEAMRASVVSATGFMYWGAISYPAQDDITLAVPPPRIELYPTPTSADTLYIWYRAKWKAFSTSAADGEIAPCPQFAEPLLNQVVKAFALGNWEGTQDTTSERLQEIENGPIFRGACRADGFITPDTGPLDGGNIMFPEAMTFSWRSASRSPVADPA